MHRLLEALSVKGSRVGSAAAEEERQEEGSACVSVHYCACAYRLPTCATVRSVNCILWFAAPVTDVPSFLSAGVD